MSSAARIEELQKKFDENPRRYFAPLANECRKAGELDAAIAICRAHLPQQPGHMSGHIVYGQALYESGEIAEARTVFETALGLDPENLIALRHMGDIAARDGDLAAARQWYRRVLEADPRNEEIQALVAGLGPDGDSAPGATTVEGLPALIDPELMAVAAEAGDDDSPFAGSESLLIPTSLGDTGDAEPAEGFSLDGFEATSFDAPPEVTVEHSPDDVSADLLADMSADAPADDIELTFFDREVPRAESSEAQPAEAPSWDMPEADEPSWREPATEPSSLAAPIADALEPDAFVTETMAELYLSQGYREQAIDVYRQLVAQQPDDERLRARLASAERDPAVSAEEVGTADSSAPDPALPWLPDALDPELLAAAADATQEAQEPAFAGVDDVSAGPTIREFLATLAQGRPVATVAAPVQAAAPLELDEIAEMIDVADEVEAAEWAPGATVDAGEVEEPVPAPGLDALFGNSGKPHDGAAADVLARAYSAAPGAPASAVASAESPDAPADPLSGRPARPAGNDLSLDSVFGTPRQPGASRNTGGFSFDQFFAEGAVKTPREESAEPSAAGDGDEDLEQFNSWLHGLKNK